MHPKGAARRVWLQGAQKLIEALVIAHSEHSRVGTSDGESAWTARLLKMLETSAMSLRVWSTDRRSIGARRAWLQPICNALNTKGCSRKNRSPPGDDTQNLPPPFSEIWLPKLPKWSRFSHFFDTTLLGLPYTPHIYPE